MVEVEETIKHSLIIMGGEVVFEESRSASNRNTVDG